MGSAHLDIQRKIALSARAIDKMKFGEGDKADIGENYGLRVSCGRTGIKSFFYRYRSPIDNALKQMQLGIYPDMSLAEARVRLNQLKAERRAGICPKTREEELKAEAKALKQQQSKPVTRMTVKELVDKYLDEVINDRYVMDDKTGLQKLIPGARKPKGQSETRRTLYGDAVRVLGERYAEDVTRRDVVSMVKAIVDRGSKVQAGRVLSELTSAYEYAIGLELFGDKFANPALLAKANFRQARVKLTPNKRRRVLSDHELRAVLRWLPTSGYSSKHQSILKITLWTGCRTGEVCDAEWCDINFEDKTWHIRKSKNQTERYVQLSEQCVEHLRILKINSNGPYLFTSLRTGKPLRQKTISETKWRLKYPEKISSQKFKPDQLWLDSIPDWNPHDLRRTVRTSLSKLGCPGDVAEAAIGHSKKGIEGTYNLHEYEQECRVWLQKWSDHMDDLLTDFYKP